MEIGKKLIATVSQGKLPQGGKPLHVVADYAAEEVEQARLSFDSVRELDNTPEDLDRRKGHVSLHHPDSADGGYRAHRYQATYKGTRDAGTVTELRHFPDTPMARGVTDGNWSQLEGESVTSGSYLKLTGGNRVEFASVVHMDADQPEKSAGMGWNMGLEAADLADAQSWQLLS